MRSSLLNHSRVRSWDHWGYIFPAQRSNGRPQTGFELVPDLRSSDYKNDALINWSAFLPLGKYLIRNSSCTKWLRGLRRNAYVYKIMFWYLLQLVVVGKWRISDTQGEHVPELSIMPAIIKYRSHLFAQYNSWQSGLENLSRLDTFCLYSSAQDILKDYNFLCCYCKLFLWKNELHACLTSNTFSGQLFLRS